MRYLIKFQYDGSKFYGFQRQKNKVTVQGSLEEALTIINKSSIFLKGAGRTDIGVHAFGQCAHFDLNVEVPPKRLLKAINSIVRPYINVVECKQVSSDFHARFSVVKKKYVYKIWIGEFEPIKADYYLMYDKKVNVDKLKECAEIFKGDHDFHNFVAGVRDNYDAIIYDIEIKQSKNEIDIIFTGKSFYRYMVRNLVGAMLEYNEGKSDRALLNKMIEDKDFNKQLSTASAKGLYLEGVYYDA